MYAKAKPLIVALAVLVLGAGLAGCVGDDAGDEEEVGDETGQDDEIFNDNGGQDNGAVEEGNDEGLANSNS